MSYSIRIQELRSIFTETEVIISDYILEHKEEVMNSSSQLLAENTNTSPAAIIRFSKKVGFSGFSQLKIELAKDITSESIDLDNLLNPQDDIQTLLKKLYQSSIQTVDKTYGLIDEKVIEQAISAILACDKIYLFGIGGSGTVCEDFLHKLLRIGKTAVYYPDTHLQLTAVPNMNKEDLGFFVSYSGKTKELLTAAKWLKKSGVKTIAITQSNYNALSKLVDMVITIPAEEKELRIGATSSRLSSLLIIDTLYYGIAKNNLESTREKVINTRKIINEIQK